MQLTQEGAGGDRMILSVVRPLRKKSATIVQRGREAEVQWLLDNPPSPITLEGSDRDICKKIFDILEKYNKNSNVIISYMPSKIFQVRKKSLVMNDTDKKYTIEIELHDKKAGEAWIIDYVHIKFTEEGKDTVALVALMTHGTGDFKQATRFSRKRIEHFPEEESDYELLLRLLESTELPISH